MLIERHISKLFDKTWVDEPSILVLSGPRQAGKTTLINEYLKKWQSKKIAVFNGDDLRTQAIFSDPNLDNLTKAVNQYDLIVIDEAQRITNIGLSLKLIFDNLHKPIIVSGSSSLDLANKINEPLTGRAVNYFLYPLALAEIPLKLPDISYKNKIEEFLRFGLYPKAVTIPDEEEKQRYLIDLVNNYLYKDILLFESIRKPKKVVDLLTLLALQIGSEVSVKELATNLSISAKLAEKYLDILEKMYVIVNLRGFSRNLRKEIYKTSKYYFVDLGLRNALIRNFNPINLRNDAGALWENFGIVERMKTLNNHGQFANFYFWRTYDQKEIDLIEERDGKLFCYEFKWSDKKTKIKSLAKFKENYPNSSGQIISPQNLESILKA